MQTYIIITTAATVVAAGEHYARDDTGDFHLYPANADADPVTTVDNSEFVAVAESEQSVQDTKRGLDALTTDVVAVEAQHEDA